MAEVWGGFLRALGAVLDFLFQVVPSYGLGIILLTIITRAIIAPLGVKQIRSMQKMQKLQPEVKRLQQQHKGDRQKLNEEMMKLYKEHGANPLGGCFPLLAQMPVFIALYAVIRAIVPLQASPVPEMASVKLTKGTICRPDTMASVNGDRPTSVTCETADGPKVFQIAQWTDPETQRVVEPPSYLSLCQPQTVAGKTEFACRSSLGTGHLPKDGKLFKALVEDKAEFLGMHLACSPNQAGSAKGIKECTSSKSKAQGAALAVYYLLVLAMAGTTFIQQRQMLKKAPSGPQAQQMKMMATLMPVIFGFLSLQFPAALSLYWVTGNVWTIAQQKFILSRETASAPEAPKSSKPSKPNKPSTPPQQGKKGKKGKK